MKAKKKNNYIDNEKFQQAFLDRYEQRVEAEEAGEDPPPISNYLGRCIQLIAENLSRNKNFINYPFREDMIGDGIENGIRAIDSFDPIKYDNPFGYFTKVIYWAFLRKIDTEKKEMYTRFKHLQSMGTLDMAEGDNTEFSSQLDGDTSYMDEFIRKYEVLLEERRSKARARQKEKKGVDKFANSSGQEG